MLSVLIPVYNYNITELVNELHDQLLKSKLNFEIICLDDCSQGIYTQKNKIVETLENTVYHISTENKGREKSRLLLCEHANSDMLLFLDADTLPCHSNFITTYITYLNTAAEAVFGGIAYKSERPPKDYRLRWNYGRNCESVNAEERNKHPYRTITSPNFLIKKSVFSAINLKIEGKEYGYDIYFASLMRQMNIPVLHIDNEVFHLGIEKSSDYLHKSEEALKTYLNLLKKDAITSNDNKLIATFIRLKTFKLNLILASFFKHLNKMMKHNLTGKSPSIKVFQLYRLSYLCYIDLNAK